MKNSSLVNQSNSKSTVFLWLFAVLTVVMFAAAIACTEDDSGTNSKTEQDPLETGTDDKTTPNCGESTCVGDQYCDKTLSPAECRDYPTGQGMPCETQEDCAGYDADFCETYVSFSCLVKECDVELNNCSDDYLCCGFADQTTFPEGWILPLSLCVNKEGTAGECITR